MINLHNLASPCSFKKSIILAMPSMGEHSVSARIGKKTIYLMLYLLDQLQNGPRGWPVHFLLLEIKYYLAAKDPTTFWSQLNF